MMKKTLKYFLIIVLISIFAAVTVIAAPIIKGGYDMYKEAVRDTPLETRIESIREKDNYTEIDDISENFTKALVDTEDRRFYSHGAIDIIAIFRAAWENIKAGHIVQGGSTLTQQLAKNMYFTFDKVYERKVAEVIVAYQLEKILEKDEILELYCNVVYFGQDCYGISDASEYYFKTQPQNLSERQSQLLVDSLKAPSINNPENCGITVDSTLITEENIISLIAA